MKEIFRDGSGKGRGKNVAVKLDDIYIYRERIVGAEQPAQNN